MSSLDPIRHCYILLLLILATLITSPALSHMINGPSSPSIRGRYQQWLSEYRRGYKDTTEQEQRFNVFKANVEFIDAFTNASGGSYRRSVNEFADLTNEEFIKHRNGFKSSYSDTTPVTQKSFMYENATNLPASIDWGEKGAMTPVKDQGQCGCCWAFSAVAAVEGITQIRTGKLVGLSVQEMVDCDKNTDNQGCNGGLMSSAFEYIQQNRGLTTQTNYPYKGADGSCNLTQAFEKVPPSEDELLKAVANQPVSAAIDGSGKDFQFYSSGIFDGECGNVLTHGVAIVGYGTSEKGTK